MGVFSRISSMFKAKVNDTLDRVEDPIQLLDQKIRDMEESLNKAKLASAEVIGNTHEIEKKLNAAKLESEDWDEKVKIALSKNNEDLAKKALQRKLDADKKYQSLKVSFDESAKKSDALKTKLRTLEAEIQKTRSYRDEACARYKNAEASKKVNEILSNVDAGANKIHIDDIERKISRKEAMAEGLADLRTDEDPLKSEFDSLDSLNLDAELEKYKNQQQ